MIIETNLVDLSKVTLDNPSTWNERIKYEIPRQWGINKRKSKTKTKIFKTEEEKIQHIKEYQHNYYMQVTKIKRKQKRGVLDVK